MFLGYFAGHMYRLALAGLPALLKMFSLWLEAFISIPCGLLLTIKKNKNKIQFFYAHPTPGAWASCPSFHPSALIQSALFSSSTPFHLSVLAVGFLSFIFFLSTTLNIKSSIVDDHCQDHFNGAITTRLVLTSDGSLWLLSSSFLFFSTSILFLHSWIGIFANIVDLAF